MVVVTESCCFPKVHILILNWNRWQDTLACLASVDLLDYPNYKVVVIDNGSSDGSESFLRLNRPDLKIIQTGTNLGFAGGFNVAIAESLKQGAPLIWILNNDTQVEPTSLSALVDVMQTLPDSGVVSPLIFYQEVRDKVWFGTGRLQFWRGAVRNSPRTPEGTEPVPMNFISGCAMLAKAEVFDNCGLLREDYFLNVEDWEFSWRVQQGGFSLYLVPGSIIYHKVSLSKNGAQSFIDYYYFVRNRLFFIKDCLPWCFKFTAFSVFFLYLPIWFGKLMLVWDWQTSRATMLGIRDFLSGKRGRRIFPEH